MSITEPSIDILLDKTENNPYLLCSLASKRACDINNMIRGQHLRVTAIEQVDDITTIVAGKDPVSIAMKEIESDVLSYDVESFDAEIKDDPLNALDLDHVLDAND